MKGKRIGLITLLLCVSCPILFSGSQQEDGLYTRRYAFIVGANHGGEDRVTLRYAVDDALAVCGIMEEMGGILAADSRFLADPDRQTFYDEIDLLAKDVNEAKKTFRRVEVFFYYSGHSDEQDIYLGNDRISYKELRDLITSLDADVRIAILDSCASGALTLPKGVIKRSPFLMDTAYDMKGYAFMTSSSASEAAQESGWLKRSFFTHYLISGMRGAADMNQDGRITLNEAYQFAFDGTLSQTEKTMAGPQHPNYHIQMTGTGDVVITEIRNSTAVLVLTKSLKGKIYIHDADNVLVVELRKLPDREISLGLSSGRYRLTNVDGTDIFESEISLEAGMNMELGKKQFSRADKIPTQLRGAPPYHFQEIGDRRGFYRWRLELFGGLASVEPEDLNMRATNDALLNVFFNEDYFKYLQTRGFIRSYTKKNEGGGAELIKHTLPVGIRLRYSLNTWLDLSIGFSRFSSTRSSSFINIYDGIENDGTSFTYTEDRSNYTLEAKAWSPSFGIHLGKAISPSLRLEAFVTGGPLLADCRYLIEWEDVLTFYDPEGDPESPRAGLLEERGKGNGLALQSGIKLDWLFRRHLGIFVEGAYAYQSVSNLTGPGKRLLIDRSEYWEGEWAIKKKIIQQEWGTMYSVYPSNGWQGFEWTGWRDRDFTLDLSGVQVKVGVMYRF